MSHGEASIYLETGNARRVAEAIAALCRDLNMVMIDPASVNFQQAVREWDSWVVAVLPGKDGWTIVKSLPWDFWGASDDSGKMAYARLCEAVSSRGIMFEVNGEGPWADLLVECDGKGSTSISGYYTEDGSQPMVYHGIALDADESFDGKIRFSFCGDLGSAVTAEEGGFTADVCRAIAEDLGGECGRRCWSIGQDGDLGWDVLHTLMRVGGPLPFAGTALMCFRPASASDIFDSVDISRQGSDCYDLGREFENWGDLALAMRWYERAADLGEHEAMIRLDDMYRFGQGIPKDEERADAWRAKALAHRKGPPKR